MNLIRQAFMASTIIQKKEYSPEVMAVNLQKHLKENRNWFKHPVFLGSTALAWIALMGYLKPHSERVSFAEHRFRLFLQASSFVVMITWITMARYYQERKNI